MFGEDHYDSSLQRRIAMSTEQKLQRIGYAFHCLGHSLSGGGSVGLLSGNHDQTIVTITIAGMICGAIGTFLQALGGGGPKPQKKSGDTEI